MRTRFSRLIFVLSLAVFLQVCAPAPVPCQESAPRRVSGEDLRKTLSYFNNRHYRAVFRLFHSLPISLATVSTKGYVSGDSGIFRIEINGFYTHVIESCFDIRTGTPYWHRWKITSMFGKKDVSIFFNNPGKVAHYTKLESGKESVTRDLVFKGQAYDPLSAMVYFLAGQSRAGKMEEGIVEMEVAWYGGRMHNVAIRIIEQGEMFRVEIASTRKTNGYALFDKNGRPLGGEGFSVPVVGYATVYDEEFRDKIK